MDYAYISKTIFNHYIKSGDDYKIMLGGITYIVSELPDNILNKYIMHSNFPDSLSINILLHIKERRRRVKLLKLLNRIKNDR